MVPAKIVMAGALNDFLGEPEFKRNETEFKRNLTRPLELPRGKYKDEGGEASL
jgi:hypothetical protein